MTDEIEARRAAPRTSYASALTRAYQDGRRILFSLPCYHMFGYVEGLLSVMFVGGAVIPGRRHRAPRPSSAAASLSRMSNPRYSESVVVGRPPEDLYDMVADVTRMGEWSPICKACWWDDGDGPRPGAWFTGRNELPERTWETRSQVVTADRGREFAFVVGGTWVRWGYTFTPVDGGTQVTESWEFLPDGISRFHDRFGDDAETQIAERAEAARRGIPVTLAAIKQAAEAG